MGVNVEYSSFVHFQSDVVCGWFGGVVLVLVQQVGIGVGRPGGPSEGWGAVRLGGMGAVWRLL